MPSHSLLVNSTELTDSIMSTLSLPITDLHALKQFLSNISENSSRVIFMISPA